jgi:hypothetical protein
MGGGDITMHTSRHAGVLLPLALSALLAACAADASEDDGSAGMSAGPPTVGMPCMGGCESGLVCANAGRFARQCTAGCNSASACQLLSPGSGAQCFGATGPQCGLPCSSDAQCPMGTTCQALDTGMACKIPPVAP